MALKPSTRERLISVGSAAVAAALSRRGLPDRRIEDLRPLSPTQDPLVGEACTAIENCRAGAVLVVEPGKPSPPMALLARRGVAGIVSAGPLRDLAEIVRTGLPAYQRQPASEKPIPVAHGEMLVGDRLGVIAIPAHLADEIAEEAAEALAFEEFTAEQVNQGGGVYGLHIPSGDRARIAFAAWRKLKGR
jgi:regulator of RNase E activity RraA